LGISFMVRLQGVQALLVLAGEACTPAETITSAPLSERL
jgi:hypothetical protein